MAAELDEFKVRNLDSGDEFLFFESATVTDSYLKPCQEFTLECGSEFAGPDLCRKLPNGAAVQILVNEKPQLTGWIDKTSISTSGHGGTKVSISGRDILAPFVAGNIDPRLQTDEKMTIADLVQLVIVKTFNLQYTIFDDAIPSDVAIGSGTGKKKKYESRHARDLALKDLKPQDNEGGFSYLSRILGHYGYWIRACPDGTGVIIAGPDYAQKSIYTLTMLHDPKSTGVGKGNNMEDASVTLDEGKVPSHVYVRGLDGGAGPKGKVVSMITNPVVRNFVPAYIRDKHAGTQEKAEVIARLFLAKQMRSYFSYECTVAGLSDRATGNVYGVDCVATVNDEKQGVEGPLWVEERTFQVSRSGKRTKLKLLPLGTLVLDWQPDESITGIKPYVDAAKDAGAKSPAKTGAFVATTLGGGGSVTYWVSQGSLWISTGSRSPKATGAPRRRTTGLRSPPRRSASLARPMDRTRPTQRSGRTTGSPTVLASRALAGSATPSRSTWRENGSSPPPATCAARSVTARSTRVTSRCGAPARTRFAATRTGRLRSFSKARQRTPGSRSRRTGRSSCSTNGASSSLGPTGSSS